VLPGTPFVFESRTAAPPGVYGLRVRQIWLTAIGRDRPGIVSRIAAVLVDHGLNIEDSDMRILGGRFSMMLLLRGEAAEDAIYRDLLDAGRELGLDYIYVHPIAETEAVKRAPTHIASLYGRDRPGQVAAVAKVLDGLGVSISGLSTHMSGESSVQELELVVPESVDIEAELATIAHERGTGVEVREL
jgi:glycine cleavage system transcriptional repressor